MPVRQLPSGEKPIRVYELEPAPSKLPLILKMIGLSGLMVFIFSVAYILVNQSTPAQRSQQEEMFLQFAALAAGGSLLISIVAVVVSHHFSLEEKRNQEQLKAEIESHKLSQHKSKSEHVVVTADAWARVAIAESSETFSREQQANTAPRIAVENAQLQAAYIEAKEAARMGVSVEVYRDIKRFEAETEALRVREELKIEMESKRIAETSKAEQDAGWRYEDERERRERNRANRVVQTDHRGGQGHYQTPMEDELAGEDEGGNELPSPSTPPRSRQRQ